MNLKQSLKGVIPDKELEKVKSSFDIIGDIAVLEIPDEIKKYEKKIAEKVIELHKNVKTVVKKSGKTEGVKRIRKVKHILGERKTKTIHTENGIKMKVDLNKVFFTPRLGNERLRILNLIKKNEIVADLFAGAGPFAVLIAKKSQCKKVIANDINKDAVKLLKENAELNKIKNMEIYNKDAKEFKGLKADRIIMNIPKFPEKFIGTALKNVKKKGTIHYYTFSRDEKEARGQVKGLKVKKITRCGDLSPGIYRYCVDIRIS